ncbi:MAG: hypothetical protein HYZ37_05985 [Candidatus Solibacter usitatus]|nr:hypothetical protein [Candidatus Solibacter usitatus]
MSPLLRFFAYLLHLPIAIFAAALGLFGWLDGAANMTIDFLPWSGKALAYWLLGVGIAGVLSALLAICGKTRALFAVYAAVVFCLTVNGVFFSGHKYSGSSDFRWTLVFALCTLIALIGTLTKGERQRRIF